MKILALETSGTSGSAALLAGDERGTTLVAEQRLPEGQRSAQSLLPEVKRLLDEHDCSPAEVGLIAVATGPGSFTGLRIGVTAAKTLAYATGAALTGVNTLAALAAGVPERSGSLWAVLDAQRQQLFAARFDRQDDLHEQAVQGTEVLAIDVWLECLRAGELVCGPPLGKLETRLPEGIQLAATESQQPRASFVGQLGWQLYQRGKTVDPLQLVPQYYRLSAAEEKAKA